MLSLNKQRISMFAKWQLASHRATLLKVAAMITSILTIEFLFSVHITGRAITNQENLLFLLWTITFTFCGVWTFPGLSSKQNRTALFLLPASNAEKFLTSYIRVVLTALILPLCSLIAADLIQWLVSLIINSEQATLLTPWAVKFAFGAMIDVSEGLSWAVTVSLLNVLWLHSFFMLSGVFFKKLQLLWGTITLGVLAVIVSTTIAVAGYFFIDWWKDSDFYAIEIYPWAEEAIKIGFCLVNLLLVVLNYWLAYRIFCRLQVINNKPYNW